MNSSNKILVTKEFRAMGTVLSVDIVVDDEVEEKAKAQKGIEDVERMFVRYEKIFSRFDDDSELCQINRSLNAEVSVSGEMMDILRRCLECYRNSEGYFDPRIIENLELIGYDKDYRGNDLNSDGREFKIVNIEGDLESDLVVNEAARTVVLKKRIDVAGLVKGWAVDKAAQYLSEEKRFENFIVEAGGDMFVLGRNEVGSDWRLSIDGVAENKIVLKLNGGGIATSGISRRRWRIGDEKVHHLINPKKPEEFSQEIKTVTVIDGDTAGADWKAKTLFLMGMKNGMEFANQHGWKALFLSYRGEIRLSDNIKENIGE